MTSIATDVLVLSCNIIETQNITPVLFRYDVAQPKGQSTG